MNSAKTYIARWIFLILFSCLSSVTSFAGYVEDADKAYNKKDYTEALALYTKALDEDGMSSELYYNIGNTQYRLNNLGQAIIAYERALKLDPSNSLARRNIEFVKTKITDRPEDDSSFLANLHSRIVSQMSPDAWAWTAFAFFVAFMSLIAVYIFTSNITVRKIGFFGGIVTLAIFVYTLVIAWTTARDINTHDTAVVIVPTTNLCSSPATPKDKTDKVVPIHEGTKLSIIDSLATPDDPTTLMWYHVKINNTSSAWVKSSDIERI